MGKQCVKGYSFLKKTKHLFLDTMFLIYHFENNEKYIDLTTQVLELVEKGNIGCSTTYLTLMEICVEPIKENRQDIVEAYAMIFETFPNLNLVPFDRAVAFMAARFRAHYNTTPPDSIQLASASVCNADLFLTNDKGLTGIKEINIAYMDDIIKTA